MREIMADNPADQSASTFLKEYSACPAGSLSTIFIHDVEYALGETTVD